MMSGFAWWRRLFHHGRLGHYRYRANTPVQSILEAVQDRKAVLITLSATMPHHLPDVQYLIRSLHGDKKTAGIKIIVGGYPFQLFLDLRKQIGADAYAGNAERQSLSPAASCRAPREYSRE